MQNRVYTWSNKRPTPIFSKIDRVFMRPGFNFPLLTLQAMEMVISDHCPLVLSCSQRRPVKKEPRWENFWFDYPEVQHIIAAIWREADHSQLHGSQRFYLKSEALHKHLMLWQKAKFGILAQRLTLSRQAILLYDKLEEIRPLQEGEFKTRQDLRATVFELANIEEKRWKQRARCLWLREGDNNTAYFHKFASSRATTNRVCSLQHECITLTEPREILSAFRSHLSSILGTRAQLEAFDARKLYPQSLDLANLAERFTEVEIQRAIMGLGSLCGLI